MDPLLDAVPKRLKNLFTVPIAGVITYCYALAMAESYTLSFYVPLPSLEACKEALFAVGAGTYPGGLYTQVCFEIRGTSQFMPGPGADPNIGVVGEMTRQEEAKVEMICVGREVAEKAVKELKRVHPYEVVAYFVGKQETF